MGNSMGRETKSQLLSRNTVPPLSNILRRNICPSKFNSCASLPPRNGEMTIPSL